MLFILSFPKVDNYHNLTKINEILSCYQKSSTLIYFTFFIFLLKTTERVQQSAASIFLTQKLTLFERLKGSQKIIALKK